MTRIQSKPSTEMPYRQQNYWPVIYIAAGFSGLVALGIAYFFVRALIDIEKMSGNPAILFLLLGMGFLIAAGGCVGTIMRKWWGRGILTYIAVLYLLVFPIGTILGFFVLRGLAVHKNDFR